MYNYMIIEKILNNVYSRNIKDYSRFYTISTNSRTYRIVEHVVEDSLYMSNKMYANLDLFFKITKFNPYIFYNYYADYYHEYLGAT